ncbi:hypothetical protein OHA40_25015 [Nocardia sp. NBC_00508]|uniref:hypothetical protein n=1 Tax=Nocardia sp. NBC_00508 TaxID=2975992 RepID=UPI002E810848|nr:hypothetical protein [Nocardia sp. NBC_00508]WUD64913.1 hypothetical protein OHA40_25015 [Nocardia sp. NBC_00508]
MIAVARADVLDRWRAQPCASQMIESIEHARFALTNHAAHSCDQFLAALGHGSVVCG